MMLPYAIESMWHRWVLCRLGRHRPKFDTHPRRGMCIYCEAGRSDRKAAGFWSRVRMAAGRTRR